MNAETADEAVRVATVHARFQPRHVEASLRPGEGAGEDLRRGEAQRSSRG